MNKTELKQCCIDCEHLKDCPMAVAWAEANDTAMVVFSFYCSEYKASAYILGVKEWVDW